MLGQTRQRTSLVALLVLATLVRAGEPAEFYRSSFEGTDGGWTADADWAPAGDWERGAPFPGPGPLTGCGFNVFGPQAAIDGTACWATRLDNCYTNADGSSFLRQTFDFTTVVQGAPSRSQVRGLDEITGSDRSKQSNPALCEPRPDRFSQSDGRDASPQGGTANEGDVLPALARNVCQRPHRVARLLKEPTL